MLSLGEIIDIDQPKKSENNPGQEFVRVYFKMFGENNTRPFATMDLVINDGHGRPFRNVRRWRGLLSRGNFLDNLDMCSENKVNADSFPILRERMDLSLEDERLFQLSKNSL